MVPTGYGAEQDPQCLREMMRKMSAPYWKLNASRRALSRLLYRLRYRGLSVICCSLDTVKDIYKIIS
jgi:hypothetical protein